MSEKLFFLADCLHQTTFLVMFVCLFADEVLTCRQGESHQVSEEIAGEVSLALVKRGRYLTTDLLC